jgi:hypothetical protein
MSPPGICRGPFSRVVPHLLDADDLDDCSRVDGLDVVSGEQSDCGLIVVEREMLRVGDLDLLALVDRMGQTGVASA